MLYSISLNRSWSCNYHSITHIRLVDDAQLCALTSTLVFTKFLNPIIKTWNVFMAGTSFFLPTVNHGQILKTNQQGKKSREGRIRISRRIYSHKGWLNIGMGCMNNNQKSYQAPCKKENTTTATGDDLVLAPDNRK